MAFDLNSVSRTRRAEAPAILLTGEPKIGKSTLAANAPEPIFIATEDGLAGIDAQAFPIATALEDVYAAMATLLSEKHGYMTAVLDSLDWLEPLLHDYVCRQNKWDSIESPGYGKGYVAAALEWRNFLDGMNALRRQRGMGVILIGHVAQKRIESPTHEGYDAWVLKLHQRAAGLVSEWADIVGFAAHKIAVKKTDAGFGNKENKAIKTGQRVLHLEAHPAYPSGTRFGLRDCELSWDALAEQLSQPAAEAA
jgi:hypothetical protein